MPMDMAMEVADMDTWVTATILMIATILCIMDTETETRIILCAILFGRNGAGCGKQ